VAASTAVLGEPGTLGLLTDTAAGIQYLVDTGSVYSIIPHSSPEVPRGPAIMGADRNAIKCWGTRTTVINAGGQCFEWVFLLADVMFPIVGADFLRNFGLVVDLLARRLVVKRSGRVLRLDAPARGSSWAAVGVVAAEKVTATTSLPTVEALSSTPSGEGASGELGGSQQLVPVEISHPRVVCEAKGLPPARHGVQHVIELTVRRPVASRYRRLDQVRLEQAKAEFASMEAMKIVRRSRSAWASPLHMVEKADGTWRPCGDYRRLNLVTKPDLYPPPHMDDLSARLAGMKWFSKIDLRKGYWQVPVAEEDVEKTAVITPFGLWEFLRMPFGLRNSGATFQRMMDDVLGGLQRVFGYLDDILVGSEDQEQHKQDLKGVWDRLQQHGLVINKEKCVLMAEQVEFLGHLVSSGGIRPLPAKVAAVAEYPEPSTKSELLSYLGMLNFYRRFLAGAALTLKPLTDATRGEGGKHAALTWTVDMRAAFAASKQALSEATLLVHPEAEAELTLVVDASSSHVGAVLQQKGASGVWQPLGFFSRKLTEAESRYSTFDRELLACVAAVRHFRHQLEGRTFYIQTDHKPLVGSFGRVSDPWTPRQQRHMAYVSQYTEDLRHVAGEENVVADAMSRPPAVAAVVPPASTGPLKWGEMAVAQREWPELAALRDNSSLQLKEVATEGESIWCDFSTGGVRPVVPPPFQRPVFDQVHGLAHAGVRATCRMISARFVWPGLANDVKEWVRACTSCCRAKVTQQETTEVKKMEVPASRFSHVHVDLVGPLPPSAGGHTYLFTMVDRSTRWPEVCLMRGTSAGELVEAFIATWVTRFGVPAIITSDRGPQFMSATWQDWCGQLGIKHSPTTAFHPQSNGMVERLHRQIKDATRARGGSIQWADHLPWVMLGLRAAPKDESGMSAGEAALGLQLSMPGQFQTPTTSTEAPPSHGVIPATKRTYAEAAAGGPKLEGATWVFVRRGGQGTPLADNYAGPFRLLECREKTGHVQMGERVEVVSRDRLKPFLGAEEPVAAEPPRRGRPPGKKN